MLTIRISGYWQKNLEMLINPKLQHQSQTASLQSDLLLYSLRLCSTTPNNTWEFREASV